jgi:GWxTD domain-containing protein
MMKKYFLLMVMFLAVMASQAQGLKAFISHKAYCTNKLQPYIEFTFIVGGNTVQYAPNKHNKYEAGVEIQVDMMQNDSLVNRLHYILSSDQFEDSVRAGKPDFADIQNVPLPQGEYFLYFYMKDVNGDTNKLSYIDRIVLDFPEDRISTSKLSLYKGISAPESPGLFIKYGYNLPPLYSNFVPESQYTLPFALEVYNTENILGKSTMKAKCYIEYAETHIAANPNNIITMEYPTKDVVLVFNEFNVFSLPSGNYFAVVQLLDKNDSLLWVDKVFFQKSNPSVKLNIDDYTLTAVKGTFVEKDTNRKVLMDMVKCLYPISNYAEREFYENRLKTISTEQMQQFFYSFWLKRNPANPEQAWLNYKKRVDEVEKLYGSKQVRGYLTDRGRVRLQYGPPDDIKEEPSDPVTLPYEIWHYHYLNGQSNVKFVFYDPVLTGHDYELLHCNMLGERQNPSWQMQLVRNIETQQDIYQTTPTDYWGNEMEDYWKYH